MLSNAETRRLIAQAREKGALVCVAEADLAAPYGEREREKHRQLCKALRLDADIRIDLKDFFGEQTANGLFLVEVDERASRTPSPAHSVEGICAARPTRAGQTAGVPMAGFESGTSESGMSEVKGLDVTEAMMFGVGARLGVPPRQFNGNQGGSGRTGQPLT